MTGRGKKKEGGRATELQVNEQEKWITDPRVEEFASIEAPELKVEQNQLVGIAYVRRSTPENFVQECERRGIGP